MPFSSANEQLCGVTTQVVPNGHTAKDSSQYGVELAWDGAVGASQWYDVITTHAHEQILASPSPLHVPEGKLSTASLKDLILTACLSNVCPLCLWRSHHCFDCLFPHDKRPAPNACLYIFFHNGNCNFDLESSVSPSSNHPLVYSTT